MTKLTGVRTAEVENPMGGGNNPNDNMNGANCASCKFHIGDSSKQEMDASQLLRKGNSTKH
ncbi:unnamed protein product [Brassica napus]|uniref:(rape) hypothetical protein n=1 Tax=Brassica napus TaxID=3708 RepID=A0A816TG84_BRANA|nr:unnamed protein product [Brassica napus]